MNVSRPCAALAAPGPWWRARPAPARPRAPAGAGPVTFGALLLFTAVLMLAPQNLFPALQPLRLAFVTAVAAAASLIAERIARGGPLTVVTPELRWAGALFGWALITIPLSYWPGGSASVALDLYAKTLILFWLLSNAVGSAARLRAMMWALTLMSVPLALTAVWHFKTGAFATDSGADVARIGGYDAPLTSNPNDLALTLNLILPLAVALLRLARLVVLRALLGGIIALVAAAVICTFSRGGFLTLAFIGLLCARRMIRRSGRPWLALVALLVVPLCVPLLPAGYLHHLRTVANFESDPTGSEQQRRDDMLAAARFVAGHPLVGAGLGMGVLALNETRGATWTKVHNVYLEHAVDLGLVGLGLFLMLVREALRGARAARESRSAELAALAEGIQVSLAAFVLAGMFHPVAYHFYFYFVAALAVAARQAAAAAVVDP